jgi:hypothetical protein
VLEQLRHEVYASLYGIEDIVAAALDYIAVEAMAYGVNRQHDFSIDALAAKAVDHINHELEQTVAKVCRILQVVEVKQESPVMQIRSDNHATCWQE